MKTKDDIPSHKRVYIATFLDRELNKFVKNHVQFIASVNRISVFDVIDFYDDCGLHDIDFEEIFDFEE